MVGKKIGSTFVSGMKKDSFVGVLLLFVYKQEIGSPLGKPTPYGVYSVLLGLKDTQDFVDGLVYIFPIFNQFKPRRWLREPICVVHLGNAAVKESIDL